MRRRAATSSPPGALRGRLAPVTFMLYCYSLFSAVFTIAESTDYNYAVQIYPVIFLTHPQSKVHYETQNLSLSCQVNVSHVINEDVPLPTVTWRHNGLPITSNDQERLSILTNSTTGFSELRLISLSATDAGVYECVANEVDTKGRYITISEPAIVTVLPLNIPVLNVSANNGENILLECPRSTKDGMGDYSWVFNGNYFTNNKRGWMLSNGSLLLLNVSSISEGSWRCLLTVEDNVFTIASYDVEVYHRNYVTTGEPLAFISANRTALRLGESLHLTCISTEEEPTEISWLYSNEGEDNLTVISTTDDTFLVLDDMTYNQSGLYMCEGGNVISTLISVAVGSPPTILQHNKSQDLYIEVSNSNFELSCHATGHPAPVITWYRNGVPLQDTSGSLKLSSSDQSNFAVYQCVAVNEFGRDSILIRVLVKGLANPVGNIKVTPVVVNGETNKLHISWTPPIQRGGYNSLTYKLYVYSVSIFGGPVLVHSMSRTIRDGSTNVIVRVEGNELKVYDIEVIINRIKAGKKPTPVCIDTKIPYYLKTPFSEFDCRTGNVSVLWEPYTPDLSFYYFADVNLKGSCLYKEINEVNEYKSARFLSDNYKNDSFVSFLLPGSVCQLYGHYTTPDSGCQGDLPRNYYKEIPIRQCEVMIETTEEVSNMTNEEGLHLKVFNRTNDTVSLHWRTEKDIVCNVTQDILLNITGKCLHKDEMTLYQNSFNITDILEGKVSFILPKQEHICSFTATIEDDNATYTSSIHFTSSQPIQNVYLYNSLSMALPESCSHNNSATNNEGNTTANSKTPTTPTTTISWPSVATYSMIPSTSSGAAESPLVVSLAVASIVVISVLVMILCLLVVTLCLRQRKKLMFEIFNEETHNGYNSSYNFLMQWSGADNVSIKTEIQSPSYATSSTAMASMSSGSVETIEISCQIETVRTTEKEKEMEDDSESIDTVFKEDLTDDSSRHTLSFTPLSTPTINQDCHVQVDTNGFTYQVRDENSVPQETSACSSGYGSQITTSSSPSQDYHESIEPDLKDLEASKQGTTSMAQLKEETEEEDETCDEGFVTTLESKESFKRFTSCPSLEDNKNSDFLSDTTHTVPVIVSDSLKNIQESLHSSSSLSSNDALSQDKILFCSHQGDTNRDNLTNVLYVDEKGYIRFICKETS